LTNPVGKKSQTGLRNNFHTNLSHGSQKIT
jgi:hypothetical protein